jgi:UDP-glucose 4-epimerase
MVISGNDHQPRCKTATEGCSEAVNQSNRHGFVTGGAGFIGSNLVDRLLASGWSVVAYDNFSTGQRRFLETASASGAFTIVQGDVLDAELLKRVMAGCDTVFHLSANADVRFGLEHPSRDLQQNTIGTFNVLEAMRANNVRRLVFASTGSVYGETTLFPTPEDAPFPVQTSLYAASKLACEGMIEAYCEGYGMQAWIFRLASVLGERYSHGHVFDFCNQLLRDPTCLRVLGDGTQRKSYVYVQDCVAAIWAGLERATERVNLFNIATPQTVTVKESIGVITHELGVRPEIIFSGGRQGWIGDNPHIELATGRLRALGWQPLESIETGLARTVRWLVANPWIFEDRA